MQLHVAGTLELFENHLVHLRACLGQSRGNDGEATAVLDVTGGTEEAFGLVQGVGIDTTREHLARCRRYRVVGSCQTGDGVEQYHYVVTALDHTFGLLQHNAGHLHVTLGRLVEGRRNNLGLYAAGHVGYLLGTFVDQEDNHVHLGVILRDGIGYIFQQYGFTGFRGSHNQTALSFADGREHIDYTGRQVAIFAAGQVEFLVGEERRQVVERNPVTHIFGGAAVDFLDLYQREIFFSLLGRTDRALDHVARLQTEEFDLRLRYIHVVGRREVVVVRRTQETIAVGHHLEYTYAGEDTVEIVGLLYRFRLGSRLLRLVLTVVILIVGVVPVLRDKGTLSAGDEALLFAMREEGLQGRRLQRR